jgi:hypothetical protein
VSRDDYLAGRSGIWRNVEGENGGGFKIQNSKGKKKSECSSGSGNREKRWKKVVVGSERKKEK